MPLYLPLKLSKNITFLLSLLSFFFLFFRYMYQPKSRTNNVKTLFFYILSNFFFFGIYHLTNDKARIRRIVDL